jgi:hypothetical protein
MAGEDTPYKKATFKMDVDIIPLDEATEDQKKSNPNAAKIVIGGLEYIIVFGRMSVEPVEEEE